MIVELNGHYFNLDHYPVVFLFLEHSPVRKTWDVCLGKTVIYSDRLKENAVDKMKILQRDLKFQVRAFNFK